MRNPIKTKLLFFVFLLACVVGHAQEYKSSRLTTSVGIGNGIFFSFEPSLRIDDKFSIHFRGEIGVPEGLSTISSISFAGQYYYSKKYTTPKFRPFLGFGIGSFSYTPFIIDIFGGQSSVSGPQIGCFPRIGFDSRHFTLAVDTNLVPEFTETFISYPTVTINHIKGTYVILKLGLTLGGGKKIKKE